MRGTNPAWANLPRRHCDDCGKSYKPKQPLREGMRGFCCANCRKSYHKHGGAYRKLRAELQRLFAREMADFDRSINGLIAARVQIAIEGLQSTPVPSSSPSRQA